MVKIKKIDLKSKDIKSEQLERLKTIFPEVVADGKVNLEQLKATLGEEIEDSKERFGMTWAGKNNCFRIIQDPSTGTLKPDRKESINFDSTKNLFIEGDNLEVLKLLQKSYYEKVKMIYIDPPYNTGRDFVYPDKFGQQLGEYLKITGQTDEGGKKLSTNTDASGRYHSDWMNMMYPRLFLARNMMKEDGVIFISIDDNEIDNLKKICNEIFGENNFIAQLPTVMNLKGNNDQFGFAGTHEYTLVFGKNIDSFDDLNGIPLTEDEQKEYDLKDEKGYYKQGATLMRTGEAGARSERPKGFYPIYVSKDLNRISVTKLKDDDYEVFPMTKDGKEMSWRRSKENLSNTTSEIIIKGNVENVYFYKKQRLEDDIKRGKKAKTLFYKPEYSSSNGISLIKNLFNGRIFDNPKPLSLLKDFIHIGTEKNDLVMDFFAGSGTTAHAVLDLNKEDNGNRKFICVQLPELTDEKSEAYKAGYKTIAEISKERIRRVIKNIKNKDAFRQDLGFKVFKLDKSNFKQWDNEPKSLQTSLTDHVEQIKKTANLEEVLYEVLLKDGFELTTDVKKTKLGNKEVFSIENNLLLICLDEKLDLNLFKEMKKLNPHVVIVLDKGFKDNDQLKTNAVQSLGKNSDEEYILRSI